MTNEERQQAIEWLKRRPVMMAGAKKMFALAVEALEAYVPDMNVGETESSHESDTEITRCSDDTISRQAAIDLLKQMRKDGDMVPWEGKNVFARIRKLPSVQLEQQEIIRCRDCKYSIDEYNDGECYCKRPSRELVWIGKSWDFFCQAGRRKT